MSQTPFTPPQTADPLAAEASSSPSSRSPRISDDQEYHQSSDSQLVSATHQPTTTSPNLRRRTSVKARWFPRLHTNDSHLSSDSTTSTDSSSKNHRIPSPTRVKAEQVHQYYSDRPIEFHQQVVLQPSPVSSPIMSQQQRGTTASASPSTQFPPRQSTQYEMAPTRLAQSNEPIAPPHGDGTINSSQVDLTAPPAAAAAAATAAAATTTAVTESVLSSSPSADPQETIKKLEEKIRKLQADLEQAKNYWHKDYRERLTYNNAQHEKKYAELNGIHQQAIDTNSALYQQTEDLHQKLTITTQKLQQREADYAKIESNFLEYMKIIRPTDDDLSTIRDKFKTLKYNINRLLMSLNKKADRQAATDLLAASWDNLQDSVRSLGTPLDHFYINMLMEKLIMDTLVKYVFNVTLYVGLPVNSAYADVKQWMDARNPQWSLRLRQQLCSLVANPKDAEIQESVQTEKARIVSLIYGHLVTAYPFIREKDKADAAAIVGGKEKGYYAKVEEIVDKAVYLSLAIRGQDVEIMTIHVREGDEQFDPDRMTLEQKSKPGGVVRFCICPPFQGGDGEHGFLEKGKVFCG
ncbi:hypothetical protein BC936DRAFT_140832 [Jimgerdemannia flammicorona]|uniref:Uncharacterized protein n=1 Tax=Jimgerdemannia flammicorona TaxID=994334 RepID=A0A433A3C3_9FUNG|nr:hypothetical protein BC936DRAFT_140832 [Jimgerdemannia flammicorona]